MSESSRANASSWLFLRCTWTYLRTHKAVASVVLLCCLAEVSFTTGLQMCFAYLVDKVLVGERGDLLLPVLSAMGGAVVVAAAIGFGRAWLVSCVVTTILAEIRARLFAHLQALPLGYFQRTPQGEVMNCFAVNLKDVERTLEGCVPWILVPGLETLITVSLLFHLDWRLALLALLVFPASIMGPHFFSPRVAAASETVKQAEGETLTAVQENARCKRLQPRIHAARTLRRTQPPTERLGPAPGFSLHDARTHRQRRHLHPPSRRARRRRVARAQEANHHRPARRVPDALHGPVLLRLLHHPVRPAHGGRRDLVPAGRPAARRARQGRRPSRRACASALHARAGIPRRFLQLHRRGAEPQKCLRQHPCRRVRRLRGHQRLRQEHHAQPRHAFLRRLRWRGLLRRRGREESLRDQCGIVFQESFLFNESVRANIHHSRPDATEDDVIAAARAAEIHDLILTLPQGYDTLVGERGGRLSGGQRQRIAIARALLRNPGILVLDEATSALDPGTEAQLNQTLERAAKGRTVLSVTHRLDAVANDDLILVFDKGELVEHGRHAELLARKGLYARLVQKQTGLHVKADGKAAIEPARLRDLAMFAKVPDPVLAEAAALFTSHTLDAGREVFREGDPADNFYFIARGRVAVFKRVGQADQRLRVLEAGDAFGEIALLQDSPRTATIRTLVPTTLLALGRDQFQGLLARSRELRLALGALADQRLEAERSTEALYRFMFGARDHAPAAPAPEQVGGVPVLQHVPTEQRLETIGLFTTVEVNAGQVIFYEGAPSDAFYLIVSGAVSVTQGAGEGVRELGRLAVGDAFGEMALLDNLPRMATLRAVEPTRLLRLRREVFTQFLHGIPAVERQLRELADERRKANQTRTRP